MHIELLSRVFNQINPQELASWVYPEPSGQ